MCKNTLYPPPLSSKKCCYFNKLRAFVHSLLKHSSPHFSKAGFTLAEVLVGLGILAILTGIATVSYRGYKLDIEKKALKNAGLLFASAVNTCIQGVGGWSVKKADNTSIEPCKTGNNSTDASEDLKSKINFTCPANAKCPVHTRYHSTIEKYRRHCLSIQKEISGKKLQVIVRVAYNNPSDYQILCGEMSGGYMSINRDDTCKGGMSPYLHSYGVFTKDKTGGGKELIPCPWK